MGEAESLELLKEGLAVVLSAGGADQGCWVRGWT